MYTNIQGCRAHAEDLYAKALAKISKKHFVSDPTALGYVKE